MSTLVPMSMLVPRLDVLPGNQRKLWERLCTTPSEFVLYGGTALALRLGHRISVDFDFFSHRPFQSSELLQTIDYLKDQPILQQSASTLSCEVDLGQGPVKVSYFGNLSLAQIEPPELIADNNIAVASLRVLFGTKCATVPQRNETKDYIAIHALIVHGKIALMEGVACARAIYGRQYNPVMTLQALSYFDDLPVALPESVRADLLASVKSVSLDKAGGICAWNDRSQRRIKDMNAELQEIAARVNWYTPTERLLADPDLFLAQVMARAGDQDLVSVQRRFSIDEFKRAYLRAPPGLFTKRAWAYWGLMLLDDPNRPMPERFPGANEFDWRKTKARTMRRG